MLKYAYQSIVFLALTLCVGCVPFDSRIRSETVNKLNTRSISGIFSNHASYKTAGNFPRIDNLASLFDVSATTSDRVQVTLDANNVLTLTWFSGTEEKAAKTFSVVFDKDGAIDIRGRATASGVVAYKAIHTRLFQNTVGDLVVIQSEGNGGLYGFLIPFGMYTKHLSIFPQQR
ncbi:MAG: hypothetical protein LBQ20_01550 [Rhodanobacter sp.]|jgi:hypothetical protein|nr:hypothetical protein [Rhodanobacter sp.]